MATTILRLPCPTCLSTFTPNDAGCCLRCQAQTVGAIEALEHNGLPTALTKTELLARGIVIRYQP